MKTRLLIQILVLSLVPTTCACQKHDSPAEQTKEAIEMAGGYAVVQTRGHTPQLIAASLGGVEVSSPLFELLASARELRELDLHDTNTTDRKLEKLAQLYNLVELDLSNTTITDQSLSVLGGFHQLRKLALRGNLVSDLEIHRLADLRELRYLDLSYTNITDEGLEFLQSLRSLEELHISGTRITGQGFRHLHNSASLRIVSLWSSEVTDDGVQVLAGVAGLQEVCLNYCRGISNNAVIHLRNTKIKKIEIAGTLLTDECMADLLEIGTLEEVYFGVDTLFSKPALGSAKKRSPSIRFVGVPRD